MNPKFELHKEYRNTKLQILAFSSVLSILSMFGCGKDSNVNRGTDLENLNKVEEGLQGAYRFFPTRARAESRNNVEEGSKNLSAKAIKENPHIIINILNNNDIKTLELLLLEGSTLKDGLTGETMIGGTRLLNIIIEHVLGKKRDKTNPYINKGTRDDSKRLFDISLETVPSDSKFLYEWAEDCTKGNWPEATYAIIKKIYETKNPNCEKTINLIPQILETQKEIFFNGGNKEEKWGPIINSIIEKNENVIQKNREMHEAFLKGIEYEWMQVTSSLVEKLSKIDEKLPEGLERNYQKTLLDEIINKFKFKDYAVQKNYIISKLGEKSCTPSILGATISLQDKGVSLLTQLLAIPDADLSKIINKNPAYGDSKNIISYYIKNLKDINLKEFLNQLKSNIEAKNPEFNFRAAINEADKEISSLSSTGILGTNYTEALKILKKAEKQ